MSVKSRAGLFEESVEAVVREALEGAGSLRVGPALLQSTFDCRRSWRAARALRVTRTHAEGRGPASDAERSSRKRESSAGKEAGTGPASAEPGPAAALRGDPSLV